MQGKKHGLRLTTDEQIFKQKIKQEYATHMHAPQNLTPLRLIRCKVRFETSLFEFEKSLV